VIGVANRGGVISSAWKKVLIAALEEGFDLASGLHNLLGMSPIWPPSPVRRGGRCMTCACRA
jgi:uncharacterized NAD-dependent epimerase/dehydratase family protein